MLCTLRGSPDSTTMPACRRVPSRTRWWCTAPVASREGIGTRPGPALLSERMRMFAPAASATSASAQIRSIARSRPSAPSAAGHVVSIVHDLKTSESTRRSCSSSSSSRIGLSITSCRACSGVSSSRLRSEPTLARDAHHDRLADRVDRRVRHLREELLEVRVEERLAAVSTASGVSFPIEPTGSSAFRASGARIAFMSSCA